MIMVAPIDIEINLEEYKNGDKKVPKKQETRFEDALVLAGFGKFHIYLLLGSSLAMFCIMVESTCIPYILPVLQCDLQLTAQEKGLLSSSVFLGLLSSSHFWGVIGDFYGRRLAIVISLIFASLCTASTSLAPNYITLLILRYLSGVFVCAPSALSYVYIGEFFDEKRRPRAVIAVIAISSFITVILPAIALLIGNIDFIINLPEPLPVLKPWRLYVLFCAVPSISACLLFKYKFPESAKFLHEIGRSEEAIEILRNMYSVNSGKPKYEYPVTALKSENKLENRNKNVFKIIWDQTVPLFNPELRRKTILIILIMLVSFTGFQPSIVFGPEIFNRISLENAKVTVCDVMKAIPTNSTLLLLEESMAIAGETLPTLPLESFSNNITEKCAPIDSTAYTSTMLLNISCTCSSIFCSIFVTYVVLAFTCATIFTASIPFVDDLTTLIIVYCIGTALACAAPGVIVSVAIDLFPTTNRGMISTLSLLVARIGVVVSNMIFSTLIEVQCHVAYLILVSAYIGGALLAIKIPT